MVTKKPFKFFWWYCMDKFFEIIGGLLIVLFWVLMGCFIGWLFWGCITIKEENKSFIGNLINVEVK